MSYLGEDDADDGDDGNGVHIVSTRMHTIRLGVLFYIKIPYLDTPTTTTTTQTNV